MVTKHSAGLILLLSLIGCQTKPVQQSPSAAVAKGDWALPYGKWGFAFFTPKALPAIVTHVRIVDTAGYLNTFNTLDSTQDNPYSVGKWFEKVQRGTHFNQASQPPSAVHDFLLGFYY